MLNGPIKIVNEMHFLIAEPIRKGLVSSTDHVLSDPKKETAKKIEGLLHPHGREHKYRSMQ